MNDDFNSPILIAQLFEGAKYVNALKEEKETITADDLQLLGTTMHDFLFDVLGLIDSAGLASDDTDKLSGAIDLLIQLRNEARANKDFATSDTIRDQLNEVGIMLKDGKDGTTYSLN